MVWSGVVTDRKTFFAWFKILTGSMVSGSPIRSIPPSRIWWRHATLMLDEPPLIVWMRGFTGFTDASFTLLQSDLTLRFRARHPNLREGFGFTLANS
jgi:hypothetical protein